MDQLGLNLQLIGLFQPAKFTHFIQILQKGLPTCLMSLPVPLNSDEKQLKGVFHLASYAKCSLSIPVRHMILPLDI